MPQLLALFLLALILFGPRVGPWNHPRRRG
jgi:hypothetical protein